MFHYATSAFCDQDHLFWPAWAELNLCGLFKARSLDGIDRVTGNLLPDIAPRAYAEPVLIGAWR
jgi:hypothetical protein